jgi:hypothetical protein
VHADYQSLLAVGKQQTDPQRFLFVFLHASLPAEHNEADKDRFHAGQGGELQAIMCVDGNDACRKTNRKRCGSVCCLPTANKL